MAVQTVLGEVRRAQLGVTLTHEHLALEFHHFYREPPASLKSRLSQRIALTNLGLVRQYPYSCRENLVYSGAEVEKAVLKDCRMFKEAGGGTIVDNTSWGLERDLAFMERAARETGVHVIAGTGHYVEEVQPKSTLNLTVEGLTQIYIKELKEGCLDKPEVRCGFIGEVGSSWPITQFERRCIEATGLAQHETGCPVSFHPGRHHKAPAEILRIYSEAGGDLNRAVMSHLDRTFPSVEATLEFSELGSYCQFDLFGTEVSFYQLCPECDMISDAERIRRVAALVGEGKADRVLASHDIHTKHRLVEYGGHGYAHIPVQVRRHMEVKGFSNEVINKILQQNPATWLTGKSVK